MSVFGKIKNVLFTEEDETEEIPVLTSYDKKEEVKKEVREEEVPRFRNINYDDFKIDSNDVKEEIQRETKPKVEEKSPFQQFDEEEFERIAAINKSKLIERDRRAREEKERAMQKYSSVGKRDERVEEKVEETHKFKPTPVISPVYGILDKNYTKEDILPRASSEGTLPKVIDVDKVREKAFGTLEELEQDMTDNLSDIKITTFEEQDIDDENIVVTNKSRLDKFEEAKEEKELELPKIEADEEKELIDDIKSDDIKDELENTEEIEKDLFNLIDSMYQSEEGDK